MLLSIPLVRTRKRLHHVAYDFFSIWGEITTTIASFGASNIVRPFISAEYSANKGDLYVCASNLTDARVHVLY